MLLDKYRVPASGKSETRLALVIYSHIHKMPVQVAGVPHGARGQVLQFF